MKTDGENLALPSSRLWRIGANRQRERQNLLAFNYPTMEIPHFRTACLTVHKIAGRTGRLHAQPAWPIESNRKPKDE